jgi:SNF2 family DNA or RNA helicase
MLMLDRQALAKKARKALARQTGRLLLKRDAQVVKSPTKKRVSRKRGTMKPVRRCPSSKGKKPARPRKHQPIEMVDGKAIIYVDIERGNRLMIKWPSEMTVLTEAMKWDEENPRTIMGRIEELKTQGAMKKVTPLNLTTAVQVIKSLRPYKAFADLYKVVLSDAFQAWFAEEDKAKHLCREAYKHLDYDEETVHTRIPGAEKIIKMVKGKRTVMVKVPFLKETLYPWQVAAYLFTDIATRQGRGVINADDTGLGKTIEAVAHLVSQGLKALVVCPAGLCLPWRQKIKMMSGLSVYIHDGDYPWGAEDHDVIIVSYALLKDTRISYKRDKKTGIRTMSKPPVLWALNDIMFNQQRVLIMDEGQYAKNEKALRTNICLKLSTYAKHSLILSATPIKNRLAELHPLLRITRRLWTSASRKNFVRLYDSPDGRELVAQKLVGENGFMVRRLTPEVWADAPTGKFSNAFVPLTNREEYALCESDFIAWLARNGKLDPDKMMCGKTRGYVLTQLLRLRQLSADGKMQEATKIVKKTLDAGEQAVVFCAFNAPLRALHKKFSSHQGKNFKGKRWHGAGLITGKVRGKKRMKVVNDFMAGKTGVLFINIIAGGIGIDLPIAAYAYFLDLPWSPADLEQGSGRLLRIGQERDCHFIKILAEATIDQRMETIIQDKALIFQQTIGDKDALNRITASDPEQLQNGFVKALIRSYMRDALRLTA